MSNDLRQALAAACGIHNPGDVFDVCGGKHPEYNMLLVAESLDKFVADIVPESPIKSPRNEISIMKTHFPKLAGLEHKTLTKKELCASDIIAAIENGTFNPGDYDPTRDDRLRTLFWLPDLLCDPDAIYRNAHKIVVGDEVYAKVYDKMGSKVKLVFVLNVKDRKNSKKIIRTVPVTSFLTDPKTAMSYVKGEPLYIRPKRKPPEGG